MSTPSAADGAPQRLCTQRVVPDPRITADLAPERAQALRLNAATWLNGTVIHYCFLDGPDAQREVVHRAFRAWSAVGIGLRFAPVSAPGDAEVRIRFDPSEGSWSYIGTQVLKHGPEAPTMNFGWDLTRTGGFDTALHEIGHTLGMPHEHQSPNAGIEWDPPAVYRYFAGAPHGWSREVVDANILRKHESAAVTGSRWDPKSVMHYPFEKGLIRAPKRYRDGIRPPGGLSPGDRRWVRHFYPRAGGAAPTELIAMQPQPLRPARGSQQDFLFIPAETRAYRAGSLGSGDVVLGLFEMVDGTPRYVHADDDTGLERNAAVQAELRRGHRYVLRARLKYDSGETPPFVVIW